MIKYLCLLEISLLSFFIKIKAVENSENKALTESALFENEIEPGLLRPAAFNRHAHCKNTKVKSVGH